MLFNYKAIDKDGGKREGSIEALNEDVAVRSLQEKGLIIVSIQTSEKKSFFAQRIAFFEGVPMRDVVILFRQLATLFSARVSALRVFRLLGTEAENPILRDKISEIADDIQGGASVSQAIEKHPTIFSPFHVSMVRVGEESGKLSEIFEALAQYLNRTHAQAMKIRNALIYPAFVIATFILVMILLLTMIFPRLGALLQETGQEIPVYTKIVIGFSAFIVDYGLILFILLLAGGIWYWIFLRKRKGQLYFDRLKLSLPILGKMFQKVYLARIADSMNVMLSSGVSAIRALELTTPVVGNAVYEDALHDAVDSVRAGGYVSTALEQSGEIPHIMIQIIRVGEETGEMSKILGMLSRFYRQEVSSYLETLVGLIEPALIVLLGFVVAFILASVLVPIYSLSGGF